MKRKLVWLALPLVLFTLIWGTKWHVDHPTPSQEDLRLRTFLSTSSKVKVSYLLSAPSSSYPSNVELRLPDYSTSFSPQESQALIESFYLSPYDEPGHWLVGSNGTLRLSYLTQKKGGRGFLYVNVVLDLGRCKGLVLDGSSNDMKAAELHPLTAKRWVELFLSNPHIGPELKSKMKL